MRSLIDSSSSTIKTVLCSFPISCPLITSNCTHLFTNPLIFKCHRYLHHKCSPLAQLTLSIYMTMVRLYDSITYTQSETSAFPDIFSSEKRLKYLLQILF